jgi:predicted Holliday junction resolvase-like endonuclease
MKIGLVQTILAVVALVLVVVNIMLALGNQSLQSEVTERQQIIAQSIQLEQLNRQVIAALANMAMKSNDEQLKNLLASVGVGLGPAAPAQTK